MKQIAMPLNQFIAEHKKLVKILKTGSATQRKKEAKEQMAELLKHYKK